MTNEIEVSILQPEGGAQIKGTFALAGEAISNVPLVSSQVRIELVGNMEASPGFPLQFELEDGPGFATTLRSVPTSEYAYGVITLGVVGKKEDGSTIGGMDFIVLKGVVPEINPEVITRAIARMMDEITGSGSKGGTAEIKISRR